MLERNYFCFTTEVDELRINTSECSFEEIRIESFVTKYFKTMENQIRKLLDGIVNFYYFTDRFLLCARNYLFLQTIKKSKKLV